MTLAKSFLTLLLAISISACASAAPTRLKTCLTDPPHNVAYCDGKKIQWSDMAGYVCYRIEDHEAYMAGCR